MYFLYLDIFTIIEDKILLDQENILFFASKFCYTRLYFSQKKLIYTLSSRLMSVRDTLISPRFSFISNKFSPEEKLRISLNLHLGSLYSYPDFYYIRKKTEFIKVTQTFNLYYFSFSCLLNFSLLPFVDTKSDKFTFVFRPFYYVEDFFSYVKNLFLKNNYNFCFMRIPLSFNSFTNGKLVKNLPFLDKCIKIFLKNNDFSITFDQKYLVYSQKDIEYTIFNYIFSGLL
jgi:hypothetical protein